MIVMCGQSWLPQILTDMAAEINYLWTAAYLTPGGQSAQVFPRKVNTFWKPLLIFSSGEYKGDWYGDVSKSKVNDNDKNHHHWGQSESGMADIIDRFTYPGDLVLDPFCGAGTTGVAAVKMNRLFRGIETDEAHIETSKRRLADASS
jgi:site-specific DNA-methyltransferase (adenine-specific)